MYQLMMNNNKTPKQNIAMFMMQSCCSYRAVCRNVSLSQQEAAAGYLAVRMLTRGQSRSLSFIPCDFTRYTLSFPHSTLQRLHYETENDLFISGI